MMHDPSVLVAILLFFIGTGILVNGSSFWEMRNNRKKYNYYFDNEKYINKNLFINENVFLGLNDEQIKLVKDKKKRYEDEEKESRNINGKTKDIFDVNMLDNFSLSDLKVLRANIEREMSLKIEYENDIKTYKKSI